MYSVRKKTYYIFYYSFFILLCICFKKWPYNFIVRLYLLFYKYFFLSQVYSHAKVPSSRILFLCCTPHCSRKEWRVSCAYTFARNTSCKLGNRNSHKKDLFINWSPFLSRVCFSIFFYSCLLRTGISKQSGNLALGIIRKSDHSQLCTSGQQGPLTWSREKLAETEKVRRFAREKPDSVVAEASSDF